MTLQQAAEKLGDLYEDRPWFVAVGHKSEWIELYVTNVRAALSDKIHAEFEGYQVRVKRLIVRL